MSEAITPKMLTTEIASQPVAAVAMSKYEMDGKPMINAPG